MQRTLSEQELQAIDAYWRAARNHEPAFDHVTC